MPDKEEAGKPVEQSEELELDVETVQDLDVSDERAEGVKGGQVPTAYTACQYCRLG